MLTTLAQKNINKSLYVFTYIVIFIFFSLFTSPLKVLAAVDTDNDGVIDNVDIDDDGDGILDKIECPSSTFYWTNQFTVNGNVANGTINGIPYTYTSSSPVLYTNTLFAHSSFPSTYNIPNARSVKNTSITNNTLTFANPITNPVLVFSSIGNSNTNVGITFSNPVDVVWSKNVTVNTSTKITGREGFAIVRYNGTFNTISFNYTAAENYANFTFGADITDPCDTDGDGLNNSVDIDSDNDGIVDNIEAQSSTGFISKLNTDMDNDGLDDAYDNATNSGITPTNTDNSDKPDYLDLDSDNDTIPDNIEAQTTAGYISPSNVDSDHDGLVDPFDNATSSGLAPVNTDTKDLPDYRDLNSDNDSVPDIEEVGNVAKDSDNNGTTNSSTGNNGYDDTLEALDNYADVNANVNDPTTYPNLEIAGTPEVDYREFYAAIALYKSATITDENHDGNAQVGETIVYKFKIKNIGNATLTDITVSDDKCLNVHGGTLASLNVNITDNSTFTCIYTITQSDFDNGTIINQANVLSKDPLDRKVIDISDDESENKNIDMNGDSEPDDPTVVNFSTIKKLLFEKKGTFNDLNKNGFADLDETITYSFKITNAGNVSLTDIIVQDDNCTPVLGGPINLVPLATDNKTFSCIYKITQKDLDNKYVKNSASVIGLDVEMNTVIFKVELVTNIPSKNLATTGVTLVNLMFGLSLVILGISFYRKCKFQTQ